MPASLVCPELVGRAAEATGLRDTGTVLRGLAELAPRTLALMHGPAFAGDGAAALRGLADAYDDRRSAAVPSGVRS